MAQKIDFIDNVIQFVDMVFTEAINKWASDIHFEPQKEFFLVRFRIDGDMYSMYEINNSNRDSIISRIKILARLKIDENRKPQDWQIVYKFSNGEDIDMRVSTFPILYWEKTVIRVLKKDNALLDVNSLWLNSFNAEIVKKSLWLKEWLLLVSGPTWSWKTTTLYAMLNSFNPAAYNISTLEDPVEYRLDGMNQSQVNSDIWYDFSAGLRTLLRQDPDIILVWEIRDRETAKLAVEASLTWHLVLGTIHANRWIWVVERLTNMWIEPYLLASSLKLVVSQRLVKKFCTCAQPKEIEEYEEKVISEGLGKLRDSVKWNIWLKKPVWCDRCLNTWTKWRLAVHEVIYFDSDFSRWITEDHEKENWDKLMDQKNYLNLYQDWLLKVAFWFTELKNILAFRDV